MNESAANPGPSRADAVEHLRRHAAGVLGVEGRFSDVRYVLDAEGRPVAFGSHGWLDAESLVLFVPADQPDALELLVEAEPIDGQSAEADRWRIYHRRSDEPRCVRLRPIAGKFRGQVFDGDDLAAPNPCAAFEAAVCRWMNQQHRSDLAAICRRFNRIEIDEALMVGLDPAGFDIRARAGIIRVKASRRVTNEPDARAILEEMCRQAQGVLE